MVDYFTEHTRIMSEGKVIERLSSDLEPLVERFMSNSSSDLEAMRLSLKHGDFETVQRLGHNAKGAGFGYGFVGLGKIGSRIEAAAEVGDAETIALELQKMSHYLNVVEVEFI